MFKNSYAPNTKIRTSPTFLCSNISISYTEAHMPVRITAPKVSSTDYGDAFYRCCDEALVKIGPGVEMC